MLVSFIAVKMYPQMMEMHFKKKIALFWAGITYIFLCLEVLGKHQKQYSGIIIIFRAVSFHCRNREKDERKICF